MSQSCNKLEALSLRGLFYDWFCKKKNFERNVFQSNREGRFFGNLVTDPRKAPMSFVVELNLAGFAILEGNNF